MPDLCELAQVKAFIPSTKNSDSDELLKSLITSTSADFLRAINRGDFTPAKAYIERHKLADRLRCTTEVRVYVNHWPCNSVTSVTVDGAAIAASDGFSDGYFLDAD